jgi:hypothetical protein
MKQTRLMSLVEAVANVVVGYGVAVVTQILIFPVFGLHTTLAQNLQMGAVFTVVSIARSYALRRLFEEIRTREARSEAAAPKQAVWKLEGCSGISGPSLLGALASSRALRYASRSAAGLLVFDQSLLGWVIQRGLDVELADLHCIFLDRTVNLGVFNDLTYWQRANS